MIEKRATLTFYGGVGDVTGANFLLNTGKKNILVDCGIVQGGDEKEARNREAFAYDPSTIDSLVVTHAHIDHIGRIPKLVRDGFTGDIHSTSPTKDLAGLLFDDALSLMQEEAQEKGVEPLYAREDVTRALAQWHTHEYHESFAIGDDGTVEFLDAGHVLGSAIALFRRASRVCAFTGDLGNTPAPLLRDTEHLRGAHYLIMESVYGDRMHEDRDRRTDKLRQVVEENRARKGTLLIPAFSIQRTQILLYELNRMVEDGVIEPIAVFLDSPLAARVTEVYRKYPQYLNDAAKKRLQSDDDLFSFPGLTTVVQVADSRSILSAPSPKIIIAGSGMSHGGRIRAHEKTYLSDRNATVLFVGFQAPGTLGRRIKDGEKKVRIDDSRVRVRAHIETISGYSAHKDRDNLIAFAGDSADTLEHVFVAMGEPHSSFFLAQRLRSFIGAEATVPRIRESHEIKW